VTTRGGRDVDWTDLRARFAGGSGESISSLAAASGVPVQSIYGRSSKERWREDRAGAPMSRASRPGRPANPKPEGVPRAPRRVAGITVDSGKPSKQFKGVPDANHPTANGRRYCKECGQTSPADQEKCLHCFEKF